MSGFVFDTLSDWPDIIGAQKASPAEKLCEAIKDKNYPAAYSALRRLEEPLSDRQAAECLFFALSCTPRLFGEVLEHCEPGEYVWTDKLPYPGQESLCINASGTILMLAAAMDRPRHMERLLERGWDVNSGAPASEQARQIAQNHHESYGRADGSIFCDRWDNADYSLIGWKIKRATPLAAAIVCGSMSAVKALLRHGGVWRQESAAVCCAGVIALHGLPEQRACLRLALGLGSAADDPDGMTREFLCAHAPDVVAIAKVCTLDELALRLDAAPCSKERLRIAAKALMEERLSQSVDNDERLFVLLDHFPEWEREQKIRDCMLNGILLRMTGDLPCDKLLERWRAACGETRDLTGVQDDLVNIIETLDDNRVRSIFAALGEGGSLCASAESDWFIKRLKIGTGNHFFEICLGCIDAYRATGEGISALARNLLYRGNARLLHRAAARGALRGESKGEMITFLSEEKASPTLRALVLTLPDGQIDVASARPQPQDEELWRQWEGLDDDGRAAFLRQMWEEPLSAETCRKRLQIKGWSRESGRLTLGDDEKVGEMLLWNLKVAACCGKNPELLRVLLEDDGLDPRELIRGDWVGSIEVLYGTMLCLAAATGRTEQVQLLLDLGLDPNEDDVPERSTFYPDEIFGTPQVVTPLYMALRKGYSKTAALLRERGGYAYPDV